MRNTIIKDLNKKAHPDGYFNFRFLIRRYGKKDYKNSQLCTREDTYQTPWLLEKVRCLAEYDNKMYCQVDKALEPLAHTIASKCKEMELLMQSGGIPQGMDPENTERMGARMEEVNRKKSDLMIQLSELKMDIETIDVALQHHLQRAENRIMRHTAAYWSGVLQAAADSDMPPKPNLELPDIPGKAVYEAHLSNIKERLNKVLSEQGQSGEV